MDKITHELIIKFINTGATVQKVNFNLTGSNYQKQVTVITLDSDNGSAENSLKDPTVVSPVTNTTLITGKQLDMDIKPLALTVIRIKNK